MTEVYLGTCGWSYKDWVGPVYRKKKESKLRAYIRIFKTVEIDSTFYRYPSKGMVMGWTRYSPDNFKFSAKLPRLITHEKMLDLDKRVDEDLTRFCDLMRPLLLNGKLACLLIQLPPKYRFDRDHLESFLKILPLEFNFAVEFRNLSWMRDETWALLKKYNVTYTIVDEPLLPPETHITSDIAYLRWHGKGSRPWYNYLHSGKELEPWVPKIQEAAKNVDLLIGYFNNHYHGYAVENCLQITEMLGELTQEQKKTKKIVEQYFERKSQKPRLKPTTLGDFAEAKESDFLQLLTSFIDENRLKRAKKMKDDELKIHETSKHQIKALIRDYTILVDLERRVILHDCPDWSRTLPLKRFCKHLGKLILSIDKGEAARLLREIDTAKESWEFKPYVKV